MIFRCKHLCCREGTDKPPRASKRKADAKEVPVSSKKSSLESKVNKKTSAPGNGSQQGTIDTVDLTTDDTEKKTGNKDVKRHKSQDSKDAEPYFQRLFNRATGSHDSSSRATGADDEFCFPLIDDFDDDDFDIGDIDMNRKGLTSDGASVMDLSDYSDMPSPDDFFRMKLGAANESKSKDDLLDKALPDPANDEAGRITDEAMSILEGELTDYEQYINVEEGNSTARHHSTGPSPISEAKNGNKDSRDLSSSNRSTAGKAALSSADNENRDPEVCISSDSLFFHGGSSTLPSSTMKRSHCEEGSAKEEPNETPCKRPRLTPLRTISPSSLNIDADPSSGGPDVRVSDIPTSRDTGEDKAPSNPPGDAWEGIDLSLLEEYRDFANFL